MRSGWLSVLGLSLLCLGPVSKGPETIRFETEIGPAVFPHRRHQVGTGIGCHVCHHQTGKGENKPCGECHKGRVEALNQKGAPAYFDVKMKLCRGCHLARRDADKASEAPIHCAECHDIREEARKQGAGP
jgi:hypothetical protein